MTVDRRLADFTAQRKVHVYSDYIMQLNLETSHLEIFMLCIYR